MQWINGNYELSDILVWSKNWCLYSLKLDGMFSYSSTCQQKMPVTSLISFSSFLSLLFPFLFMCAAVLSCWPAIFFLFNADVNWLPGSSMVIPGSQFSNFVCTISRRKREKRKIVVVVVVNIDLSIASSNARNIFIFCFFFSTVLRMSAPFIMNCKVLSFALENKDFEFFFFIPEMTVNRQASRYSCLLLLT